MSEWNEAVETRGGYISTKEGCDITLKDVVITKNTNPMYQPTKKDGEEQGYAWEVTGGADKIGVTTYALQKALMDSGAKEGDSINIKHPAKGEYVVTIVPTEEAPF